MIYSEPTTVTELIKLHGEGIKIISEAPQIRGTEIWSNVRPLKDGNFHGELWRKNEGVRDGRNVGVHTLQKKWADAPLWRRYDVATVVPEVAKLALFWSNEDPRESIDKRAEIVVVAPEGEAFCASVETKHAYCVFLKRRGNDVKSHISEGDEWPTEWKWARAP